MHIFIDETGVFANPSKKDEAVSAVCAVVISSKRIGDLVARFLRLKASWGYKNKEAKGSKLTENQIAGAIDLLHEHGARAKLLVIDLGLHSDVILEQHRDAQAGELTAPRTPELQESMRKELQELGERLRRLSLPLYVQLQLLTELVAYVIDNFSLWYALRDGDELGKFIWAVDAKDVKRTDYEMLWQILVPGFLQSRSLNRPLNVVDGGDYRAFERFKSSVTQRPEWLPQAEAAAPTASYYDPKRILLEDFRFLKSDAEVGLQLADIVATTLRRALVGNLKPAGWQPLKDLVIQEKSGAIGLLALRHDLPPRTTRSYGRILTWLDSRAGGMLPKEKAPTAQHERSA